MKISGVKIPAGVTITAPAQESQAAPTGASKFVVGAYADDDAGGASGSAYVYNIDGTGEVKLTASDGAANDIFGYGVAISDTKVVVGARGDDNSVSDTGSVYVYNTDGTGELKITASDGASGDEFGDTVAIQGDKIIVGAPGDDNSGFSNSGSAYIYNLDGTGEVIIQATGGAANDRFGSSVAISDTKVVVGAIGNNGAVYVYNIDGTGEVKITASDGADNDQFGQSVAITDTKIIVGAMQEDKDPVTAYNSGSVYVYNLDGTGEVKITASDASAQGLFGSSVDATDTKIVVGSEGDNSYAGAVYVYNLDGTGELKITASDSDTYKWFGRSVAVSDTHIIVGAFADNLYSGSAYVYNLDGTGEVKIVASDAAGNDRFGTSVAAS